MKQIETRLPPPKVPFYDEPDFNPFLAYAAAGFATFTAVNHFAKFSIPSSPASANQFQAFYTRWKWRNTLTSFIHSFISGVWAPLAFFVQPSLADDMINSFSRPAHVLVSFSMGYFAYDFLDMLMYARHKSSTKSMLMHHTVVVVCFGIAAVTRSYVPYAALSLVVEINSVFLHARQLLKMVGWPQQSISFRLVALANLVTFIFCRILLLGWMTRWITLHRDQVPLLLFTVGSVGLATIFYMNIDNFYRILMSDFLASYCCLPNPNANATTTKRGGANSPSVEESETELMDELQEFGQGPQQEQGALQQHPVPVKVTKLMSSFFTDGDEDEFEPDHDPSAAAAAAYLARGDPELVSSVKTRKRQKHNF